MAAKTVLITGTSRGIGLAFVEHYMAAGWNVIAAARNVDKADKLRALQPYKLLELDVADEESILRAAKELEGEAIDVLINNAGVLYREMIDSIKKESFMHQFEVNSVGPFLVTRAFQPHLKRAAEKSGVAKVANLSSTYGSVESTNVSDIYGYRASKAALNMITKMLSINLRDDNIIAMVFCPGWVDTDMSRHLGPVQAKDSVAMLTAQIDKATFEESGKYYEHTGRPLPW